MSKKGIFSSRPKKKNYPKTFLPLTCLKSTLRCFLLDFFCHILFPSSETNKRTPNTTRGTCRAAQRPEQVPGARFLLRETPADIPACQLSLLPSPGVTSLHCLTQGDPSASSTRPELRLGLDPKFCWLLLLQVLAGTFALGAPRSTSPPCELNYQPWFLQSQPGRLESCWT